MSCIAAAHPQLLYKFIYQTMQPGPPVSLKCIATGNPTPHITWHLDGFPLPQNDRCVLHILKFERSLSSAGPYTEMHVRHSVQSAFTNSLEFNLLVRLPPNVISFQL
jgi:hypothetical protein